MHAAALLFLLFILAPSQDNPPTPVLSNHPLTAEQIAVYHAVLMEYTEGEDTALNIANVTEPFSSDFEDRSCLRGIPTKRARTTPVIHHLDPSVLPSSQMRLVDPNHQQKAVEENDPSNAIHSSIAEGHPLSDQELEQSVKQAFATGLFTFSEIVFNQQHTRAALSYSFHCGLLCGNGRIVVLKKVQGKWKTSKLCGAWMS